MVTPPLFSDEDLLRPVSSRTAKGAAADNASPLDLASSPASSDASSDASSSPAAVATASTSSGDNDSERMKLAEVATALVRLILANGQRKRFVLDSRLYGKMVSALAAAEQLDLAFQVLRTAER